MRGSSGRGPPLWRARAVFQHRLYRLRRVLACAGGVEDAGGLGAGEVGLFGAGGVAGGGSADQVVEGLGEVGLVLVVVTAAYGGGADVVPGAVVEGLVDVVAVDPGDLDQVVSVGQADPDLAQVVGVVVDLPPPAACGGGGGLAAVGAEEVQVVGAPAQADAVVADGEPAHGQQLQVVPPGQRNRHVPADGGQRAPHLIRCQPRLGQHGVAQPVVGAVVPVDDPLVEEALQLGDAVTGVLFDVAAALGDVGAGVAGQVLPQQGIEGAEGALHDALRSRSARRGGLDADPEGLAGGGERLGEVDLPAVDDDRLRHDDRPRRGAFEALVGRQQFLPVRDGGAGEAQHVGPGGAGGVGDGHLREQQRGVDGLGAGRAQHGGQDRAGGDVDGDRQLGPAQGAVVEDHEDVQARGVDLHLLARAQRHGRGERPSLPGPGDAVPAAVDVLARVGEGGDQPVEGGLRAHRHRVPVPLRQNPGRHRQQGLDRALGAPAPTPDRLLHRGHHPLVRAPREA
ncbi:hypothetical protein, partial [Kitasatospora purpeofusca]|uniref:hypothetical protein n=1 Tax=Kitasatospora purpeofusca TaxID=67352 RepID=UPI00386EE8F7